jgi:hypothetical protein
LGVILCLDLLRAVDLDARTLRPQQVRLNLRSLPNFPPHFIADLAKFRRPSCNLPIQFTGMPLASFG